MSQRFHSHSPVLPYLALGVGILALGFSALFVRWAGAPGPVMAFYRLSIASLFLTPAALRRGRGGFPAGWAWLSLAILGGLLAAFDQTLFNIAVRMTAATNATLLNSMAPLWVALFAWQVFGERMEKLFWTGLALTLFGAVAVLGSDFIHHPALGWGDVVGLVSSLFYAGYFLVTQRARRRLDALRYVWLVALLSSLFLMAFNLATQQALTGYPLQTYLAFLGAGLVSHVSGYVAVAYALGHLPASVVSPTMIGQPVMTGLLAFLFLGERLTSAQWMGGLTVLVGIYLVHRSREVSRLPQPVVETA